MPSHTIPGAMLNLFLASDPPGAPFNLLRWQEITCWKGDELFPEDPRLLPDGWTQDTVRDLKSFFEEYKNKRSEDERQKFISRRKKGPSDPYPGRAVWNSFISSHWSAIWHMNSRITAVFTERNLHPLQIMVANNNLDVLPSSDSWIPLVIDDVARELFGTGDGVTDASGRLLNDLREPTKQICQRVWTSAVSLIKGKKKRLVTLQSKAEAEMKGSSLYVWLFCNADLES